MLLAIVSLAMVNVESVLAAELEPLHGLSQTETFTTIAVTSTGCTKKEDFTTILEKSNPPIVSFIRLKPDPCRTGPFKMNIEFNVEEVGANKFEVANLFTPAPEL